MKALLNEIGKFEDCEGIKISSRTSFILLEEKLQDLESYLVEQVAYYSGDFMGIFSRERADAKAEAYQDILNKYRGEK